MKKFAFILYKNILIFFIAFVISILVTAGQAEAETIIIDPPLGDWGAIDIYFNDLNGTAVSGESLSLDIIFGEKSIFARNIGSYRTEVLLYLFTDYTDFTNIFSLPGTGFIFNEFGVPLTPQLAVEDFHGNPTLIADIFIDLPGDMFSFHGVHYDLTLPVMPGAYIISEDIVIRNEQFRDKMYVRTAAFPEPTTMLLLGLGLMGLTGIRRKFHN